MLSLDEEKVSILKAQYVELCCLPRLGAIKGMEHQISEQESRLVQYQRALIATIRDVEFKKMALESLKIIPDMKSKEIEFDKLITHPDIEKIEVASDHIRIHTVHIEIEHEDAIYNIGRFIIYLYIENFRNGPVVFENVTRSVGYRPHPHVNEDGRPCLGNIQECLPQMIAAHQYAAAISVAIQYLKSYTNDAEGKPYLNIRQWPVKTLIRRGR